MSFTASDVKALREKTGAGMMDCKKALGEVGGDFEKAVTWLREKGIADSAKRADRVAKEGAITSYIHMGGKYGVLLEVNCETDFVARCDDFQNLCKDLCMQICSAAPRWVRREDVPEDIVNAERDIYMHRAKEMGKPDNILAKIADGMLVKWYKDVCLLEQAFVKDPDKTIEGIIKEISGKLGEKIEVPRFVRFALGETAVQK